MTCRLQSEVAFGAGKRWRVHFFGERIFFFCQTELLYFNSSHSNTACTPLSKSVKIENSVGGFAGVAFQTWFCGRGRLFCRALVRIHIADRPTTAALADLTDDGVMVRKLRLADERGRGLGGGDTGRRSGRRLPGECDPIERGCERGKINARKFINFSFFFFCANCTRRGHCG